MTRGSAGGGQFTCDARGQAAGRAPIWAGLAGGDANVRAAGTDADHGVADEAEPCAFMRGLDLEGCGAVHHEAGVHQGRRRLLRQNLAGDGDHRLAGGRGRSAMQGGGGAQRRPAAAATLVVTSRGVGVASRP